MFLRTVQGKGLKFCCLEILLVDSVELEDFNDSAEGCYMSLLMLLRVEG